MTTKHNCPPHYKEELKEEIIAQSAAIYKKINEFDSHRFDIIIGGFMLLALATWMWIIHPVLFPVTMMCGFAWVIWEWHQLSKKKRNFMQQNHEEIHRLAQIFLQERQGRKEYCLEKLKDEYSNNPGLQVNS